MDFHVTKCMQILMEKTSTQKNEARWIYLIRMCTSSMRLNWIESHNSFLHIHHNFSTEALNKLKHIVHTWAENQTNNTVCLFFCNSHIITVLFYYIMCILSAWI